VLFNACKTRDKGGWHRSRDLLLNFDFKLDFDECDSNNAKLRDKRGVAYVT